MSSLFQNQAEKATGEVNSGYLTVDLTILRFGGHPQARATLGRLYIAPAALFFKKNLRLLPIGGQFSANLLKLKYI